MSAKLTQSPHDGQSGYNRRDSNGEGIVSKDRSRNPHPDGHHDRMVVITPLEVMSPSPVIEFIRGKWKRQSDEQLNEK